MSDLARTLAKEKPSAPRPTPADPTTTLEEDGDSSSSASSISSVGTIIPSKDSSAVVTESPAVPWYDYFSQELYLQNDKSIFHVYITPPQDIQRDPLFVCHHGAGSCGLSFALMARNIRRRLPRAGILAVEARDHGYIVQKAADHQASFALEEMSDDFVSVIHLVREKMLWPKLPDMVFVGHSLGGAVVTDVASKGVFTANLVGFVVIDVVEGSVMDAIKAGRRVLDKRPSVFKSVGAAIDWHIRSGFLRNAESAAISVPTLLRQGVDGSCSWRTDLTKTQPFWESWYRGMNSKFLSGEAAKLLIIAGTNRLDKTLMIGQMQGKFQLHVFPEAGHFVQEDVPEKTADALVEFYKRNDRSALILPPKVSDLIAQGKKV